MSPRRERPDWITLLRLLFTAWGATGIAGGAYFFIIWPRSRIGTPVFDIWHLWFQIGGNLVFHAVVLGLGVIIFRRPRWTRASVVIHCVVISFVVYVQSNFGAWQQYKQNGIPPWKSITLDETIGSIVNVLSSARPLLVVLGFLYTGARRAYFEATGSAYCAGCGYDLTGNESGVCPECGRSILSERESGSV